MWCTLIRKNTFRYIEAEIYDYHDTIKKIKNMREEILHNSSFSYVNDPVKTMSISDPTGRKATLMASNQMLLRSQDVVDSIYSTYEELDEHKKQLMKLKYWTKPQTLTIEGIAQKINIGKRQAIRWRRDIVYRIAYKLGLD